MFSMRWVEFFEGDNNRLSMSRLLMFLSFFPAAYELFVLKNETALGYFLGAYVLGYVGGKCGDAMNRRPGQGD